MRMIWKRLSSPHVLIPFGVGLFFAGLIIGYFIPYPSPIEDEIHSFAGAKYTYVNPLLSCGDIASLPQGKVKKTEDDVSAYVAQQKRQGKTDEVSVYFRDLNNGGWFGLNIEETFSPGSLLKVPMLLAAYKRTESDPSFLSQNIAFASSTRIEALSQEIPTADPIRIGKSYSIQELLQHMILDSDNNALNLVYATLGIDTVNQTFVDLGVPQPTANSDYNISVRDYARFFRVLYNATYLSPNSSEQALKLLSETRFKTGLVAGVPETVNVAHKFGERELGSVDQLHDCGIIYAQNQPYVLCVMTRGSSLTDLSSVIAGISGIVYNDVSN